LKSFFLFFHHCLASLRIGRKEDGKKLLKSLSVSFSKKHTQNEEDFKGEKKNNMKNSFQTCAQPKNQSFSQFIPLLIL
jgi:hypothetical protein